MKDLIEKISNIPSPSIQRERLTIKSFKTAQAMHTFLNKGDNGLYWKESNKGIKPGVYAFVGGQWHNVKTLDASVLSHV